jgi:hypothetical protein
VRENEAVTNKRSARIESQIPIAISNAFDLEELGTRSKIWIKRGVKENKNGVRESQIAVKIPKTLGYRRKFSMYCTG